MKQFPGQRLWQALRRPVLGGAKSRSAKPVNASRATTKTIAGDLAEQRAEQYLQDQGLTTKQRNYRCKLGEIDLIMGDGASLVFVEVRYRQQTRYGTPEETVTAAKQRRLVRTAQHYLQAHGLTNRVACRFDVVSVGRETEPRWIKSAFDA